MMLYVNSLCMFEYYIQFEIIIYHDMVLIFVVGLNETKNDVFCQFLMLKW